VARPAAIALFRIGRWFGSVTRACNHLAAGTLRVDELRRGTERTWENFAASDAAIAAGLMDWEEELFARFVSANSSVLLVGSGPGRDLVALVQRGFQVVAVEPARRANQTAARHLAARGLTARIIEGFFEDVAVDGPFDAVVFSYCCYSFIPDSQRRVAALQKAAGLLADAGCIIVSYLTERPSHPLLMRLARASAAASGSDWRPQAGDILHVIDSASPLFHYEHAFAPREIEAEAARAGLRCVHHNVGTANPAIVLMR
jgi:SAM-dependent methyltransferase